MNARGMASPGTADALACTFAVPVPIEGPEDHQDVEKARQAVLDWTPMAAMG